MYTHVRDTWTYRCTFHERMRRLVYLANAIPELFICLLPGSASRECLYIRANTPRELVRAWVPSCSRPTWLCCCRTRTIGSLSFPFLRFYSSVSRSTFVSVTAVSLLASFFFPTFPACTHPSHSLLSLSVFRQGRNLARGKKNRKSTKKITESRTRS